MCLCQLHESTVLLRRKSNERVSCNQHEAISFCSTRNCVRYYYTTHKSLTLSFSASMLFSLAGPFRAQTWLWLQLFILANFIRPALRWSRSCFSETVTLCSDPHTLQVTLIDWLIDFCKFTQTLGNNVWCIMNDSAPRIHGMMVCSSSSTLRHPP